MIEEHTDNETAVKPFLVYVGSTYYPCAGADGDLVASADTLEEARQVVSEHPDAADGFQYGWWAIYDHRTLQCLESGPDA